jgi:hypothetical protein
MQVIPERLGEALDPPDRNPHSPVRGRRQQQPSARRQHAPDLREPAGRVGNMLDHLARPNEVEGAIPQRQRPLDRGDAEIEARMPRPGSIECRLRDLDPNHGGPGARELGREVTDAATEVQRPIATPGLGQEVRPAHSEVRWGELIRQPLPEIFVVCLHGATVSRRPPASPARHSQAAATRVARGARNAPRDGDVRRNASLHGTFHALPPEMIHLRRLLAVPENIELVQPLIAL